MGNWFLDWGVGILYLVLAGAVALWALLDGDPEFWGGVWPGLVATLLAVPVATFFGVLVALRLDRRQARRAQRTEERSLLRAARLAVGFNLELVDQLNTDYAVEEGKVPTFSMDRTILEGIIPRLAQISSDVVLVDQVVNFTYQIGHLDAKLATLRRQSGDRRLWTVSGAGSEDHVPSRWVEEVDRRPSER